MTGSGSREALARRVARLLRQRGEVGGGELFLEGLTREEVLGAVRLATSGAGDVEPALAEGSPDSSSPSSDASAGAGFATRMQTAVEDGEAVDEEATGSPAASAFEAELAGLDYESLRETALECTRCPLSATRTQVVFSDGSPDARLVVVGEAPGANEDREGLPFVGPAGKLLDLLMASVGLSRGEDVYICNVIKCRPPGNRNPTPAEIAACSPYLRRQIAAVSPEAVLAVGSFAAKLLTGTSSALGRLRGEVYSYEGVPLVVTYHPAALLRNSGWTRPAWDDLQLLRGILDAR